MFICAYFPFSRFGVTLCSFLPTFRFLCLELGCVLICAYFPFSRFGIRLFVCAYFPFSRFGIRLFVCAYFSVFLGFELGCVHLCTTFRFLGLELGCGQLCLCFHCLRFGIRLCSFVPIFPFSWFGIMLFVCAYFPFSRFGIRLC